MTRRPCTFTTSEGFMRVTELQLVTDVGHRSSSVPVLYSFIYMFLPNISGSWTVLVATYPFIDENSLD